MFYKLCLFVSICNFSYGSQREDIILGDISHHNHWGAEQDEQHRERLPAHLVHNASTSIVSARLNRGVIDLAGVPRVTSEDSPDKTVVNVATTIDVKAKCCNSNCCDDDKDNKVWCCC